MKRVRSINPLSLGLLGWCVTLVNFGIGNLLVLIFGQLQIIAFLLYILIGITICAPIMSLAFLSTHYKSSAISINRVIILYLGMVLICANINFDLMLHLGFDGQSPFTGVPPIWDADTPNQQAQLIWINFFMAIACCLHFSIATLSTFNDGQIVPNTWYSKLIVDVQVLMGLGITVLTVGRHFSRPFDRSISPPAVSIMQRSELDQSECPQPSVLLFRRSAA